jgi:hypothetical protein
LITLMIDVRRLIGDRSIRKTIVCLQNTSAQRRGHAVAGRRALAAQLADMFSSSRCKIACCTSAQRCLTLRLDKPTRSRRKRNGDGGVPPRDQIVCANVRPDVSSDPIKSA